MDQEIRLFIVSFNVKIQYIVIFKVKYPKVDCGPIRTFVCETHWLCPRVFMGYNASWMTYHDHAKDHVTCNNVGSQLNSTLAYNP